MLDVDAPQLALDSPGHTLRCKFSLMCLCSESQDFVALLITGCQSVYTCMADNTALLHRVSYPNCWYSAFLGKGEMMCPHAGRTGLAGSARLL